MEQSDDAVNAQLKDEHEVVLRNKHNKSSENAEKEEKEDESTHDDKKRHSAPIPGSRIKSDSCVSYNGGQSSAGGVRNRFDRRRIFSHVKQESFEVPEEVKHFQPEDNVFAEAHRSSQLAFQRSISMPAVLPDVVPSEGSASSSSPDVLEVGDDDMKNVSAGCGDRSCDDNSSNFESSNTAANSSTDQSCLSSSTEMKKEQEKKNFEGSVCYDPDPPVVQRRKKSVTFDRSVSNTGMQRRSQFRKSSGYGSGSASDGSRGESCESSNQGSVMSDDVLEDRSIDLEDFSSTKVDGSIDGDKDDEERKKGGASKPAAGDCVQDTQEVNQVAGAECPETGSKDTAEYEDWQRENSPKVNFTPGVGDDLSMFEVQETSTGSVHCPQVAGDDFSVGRHYVLEEAKSGCAASSNFPQASTHSEESKTGASSSSSAAKSPGPADSTKTSPTTKEEYEYDLAKQQFHERMCKFDNSTESITELFEWVKNEIPLLISSPKSPYCQMTGRASPKQFHVPQAIAKALQTAPASGKQQLQVHQGAFPPPQTAGAERTSLHPQNVFQQAAQCPVVRHLVPPLSNYPASSGIGQGGQGAIGNLLNMLQTQQMHAGGAMNYTAGHPAHPLYPHHGGQPFRGTLPNCLGNNQQPAVNLRQGSNQTQVSQIHPTVQVPNVQAGAAGGTRHLIRVPLQKTVGSYPSLATYLTMLRQQAPAGQAVPRPNLPATYAGLVPSGCSQIGHGVPIRQIPQTMIRPAQQPVLYDATLLPKELADVVNQQNIQQPNHQQPGVFYPQYNYMPSNPQCPAQTSVYGNAHQMLTNTNSHTQFGPKTVQAGLQAGTLTTTSSSMVSSSRQVVQNKHPQYTYVLPSTSTTQTNQQRASTTQTNQQRAEYPCVNDFPRNAAAPAQPEGNDTQPAALPDVQARIPDFGPWENQDSLEYSDLSTRMGDSHLEKVVNMSQCSFTKCSNQECLRFREEVRSLKEAMFRGPSDIDGRDRTVLRKLREHYMVCDSPSCPVPWCRYMTCRLQGGKEPTERLVMTLLNNPVHTLLPENIQFNKFLKLDSFLALEKVPKEWSDWLMICPLSYSYSTAKATPLFPVHPHRYWVVKMTCLHEEGNQLDVLEKLRDIQSPHVVKHLWAAVSSSPDMLVVCTEFLSDFSLRRLLDQKVCLCPTTTRHYLQQILLALKCLHEMDIVYLNWASSNLLLDERCEQLKLSNFTTSVDLSKGTADVGTVQMSLPADVVPPELIEDQELCRKSDSWGLACVLHEMLTGQRPWFDLRHERQEDIRKKIMEQALPDLEDRLPPCAKMLIQSCLQKIPDARPSVDNIHQRVNMAWQ